jgi:hypothetical protein
MLASARNAARYFVDLWACEFRARTDHESIFLVGPSKQEETLMLLPSRAGSSGTSLVTLSLAIETLHRQRVGFEPQRASLFRKRAKCFLVPEEAVQAYMMAPLYVLPRTQASTTDRLALLESQGVSIP